MAGAQIPGFGKSLASSNLSLLLTDQLAAMGDYLTQEVGSLNWVECNTNARLLNDANEFVNLLARQLSPNSASIYLNQWAAIYNIANNSQTASYIEQKQAQFGTPPTLANITSYISSILGSIFIDLEVAPELQQFASGNNPGIFPNNLYSTLNTDGYPYNVPLEAMYVYVWQPRDNQDNLLMPTPIFNNIVESYHTVIQAWNPAYARFLTMNLVNRGNQDGYGGGYNGLNYNNYLDGYNVISGTAGDFVISGTDTTFKVYPNGDPGDFRAAIDAGFNPPIQVVDDMNELQTYYIAGMASNTHMTTTTALINNITNRTYRCLGEVLDTVGMLDRGMLSNSSWIT